MIVLDCINSVKLALKIVEETYKESPTQELLEEKKALENKLNLFLDNCKQMNEIENRLYYKIAYEGKGIMQACGEVADENYFKDIKPNTQNHIYQKYYKKIRKFL